MSKFLSELLGPKLELENFTAYHCKWLYLDAITSSQGTITWKLLKPIVQGKILYGPFNSDTQQIISLSNKTFEDLAYLKEGIKVFNSMSKMFKTNLEFQKKYNELLHNPIILESLATINSVVNNIFNKIQTSEMLNIIDKALNCFSVDRFVSVKDEKDFEVKAHRLLKTNESLAGVYFQNIEV